MECLLCYFKSDEQMLKAHYEGVHRIDPTNPHFRNLFRIEATTDIALLLRSRKKKSCFFKSLSPFTFNTTTGGQRSKSFVKHFT